jgi:hypothetical protein
MRVEGQLDITQLGHRGDTFLLGVRSRGHRPLGNHHGLPPVSRHTTKLRRTSSIVMLEMHYTVKRFGAKTSSSCVAGSSKWTTWCSGSNSPEKVQTISPPTVRVHSG